MHCKICGDWTCEKITDRHHMVAYSTVEDTDGFFHYHDKNGRWQTWKCSKGHEFNCAAYNQCWCGWNSKHPEIVFHVDKPIDPNQKPVGYKFNTKVVITNDKFINQLIYKPRCVE